MKNKIIISIALLAAVALATSCIKETFPQDDTITGDQVADSPKGFASSVSACTGTLAGSFTYGGNAETIAWDFGYPSFFLQRDVMGQDIAVEDSSSEWYSTWYQISVGLGPQYQVCQAPWTYYYKWINNCNITLKLAGGTPSKERESGAGIAHALRAMFYMDLARMFQYTYKGHEQDGTVPIVTEKTTNADLVNNPRATNERMWAFILEDLDKAEIYLANYNRPDVYTPNLSVVYGLKARAYLTIENWEKAEEYAKKAQEGYTPLTEAEYLDRMTAFNTPNHAWMFGLTYLPTDPNILLNDSDSNWGSQMFLEIQGGCYASAYGGPKRIDAHLYSTIPANDFRKKCYIDPAIDAIATEEEYLTAIAAYSDYPELISQAAKATTSKAYGCLSLKFRAAGGADGRTNPYKATCAAVPMMRVEEMMLIEAEAAGMQQEARGIALLKTFAALRNPSYTYDQLKPFRDNVWWQRRVELWGEGFATFDIKRLNKGIVRSYAGTNHPSGYRYNTEAVPGWTNLCIVDSEGNYNSAIVNNPTPVQPAGDSPEYVW